MGHHGTQFRAKADLPVGFPYRFNSSYCMLLWQFLMFFFKMLMQTVLTRCKIVFWYWFMQNENGKLLMCDCFALLPLKKYLKKFCKRCQQKALHQIKFILRFFGLKTCKDDCYLQKINLSIKKIPSNQVFLLLKNQVTVEWFLSSVPYFFDKSGRYLDLNQS